MFSVSAHFIVATGCGFRLNLTCCGLHFCLRTAGMCNEETGNGQKNFKNLSGMLQRYDRTVWVLELRCVLPHVLPLRDSPKKERLSKTCNEAFVYE